VFPGHVLSRTIVKHFLIKTKQLVKRGRYRKSTWLKEIAKADLYINYRLYCKIDRWMDGLLLIHQRQNDF